MSVAGPSPLWVVFGIDCESTQPAVRDAALGERASRGFADVLEAHGFQGTFYVIPTDLEAHASLYRNLRRRGHEIGLHVHPAAQGYGEFLGVCGPDEQRKILGEAAHRFAATMGERPVSICMGYASTNDHTYPILHELGFRQGPNSIPTRVLPECASIHAGAPLEPHYAHRFNRALAGDLDFVETPNTIDPDSRLWGGKHPQDLRIELVDAKNHYYTIAKAIKRQLADGTPLKSIRATTHNTFDYSDASDFRVKTLQGVIAHTIALAAESGLRIAPTTISALAAEYRRVAPIGATHEMPPTLELDRRAYSQPVVTTE
jgi:hypothetical protein